MKKRRHESINKQQKTSMRLSGIARLRIHSHRTVTEIFMFAVRVCVRVSQNFQNLLSSESVKMFRLLFLVGWMFICRALGASNSENAKRNQIPFLAILFDKTDGNRFFCAGSLTLNRHVITAAQCMPESVMTS